MKDSISRTIAARESRIVEFTKRLIGIATENPPGELYEECTRVIADELESLDLDFDVVRIPAAQVSAEPEKHPRFAVIARHGAGEPTLYFHGHYDVVPADGRGQFEPRVSGGKIHGRGSSDMKSGLAAMIYAVDVLKTRNTPLDGSVCLVIVPDEETGGARGSRYLTEEGVIARSGIGMLTAEPTSGAVWNASRGAISLLIKVKGVPMHVGLQHDGVNAFDNMLLVANALTRLKCEVEQRTTQYNIQPDTARRSIMMLGGRCEGGTNFNLVPGECSFTVDRRINPEEDLHTEKQRMFDLLDEVRQSGVNIEVEVLQEGGSAGVPEDTPAAVALSNSVEQITGKRPTFEMCPGLLEIRFYAANGIPAFAYGPGLLAVSHGPNEFVPIANILDCTATYALTACELLSD